MIPMGTLKIVLFVIVMLMSGCTIKGIVTTGAGCLTNILSDRDDFFCNNKALRAWNHRQPFLDQVNPRGDWKYYEKDLFSGMIYDTRYGRRCPRNSWRHWCFRVTCPQHPQPMRNRGMLRTPPPDLCTASSVVVMRPPHETKGTPTRCAMHRRIALNSSQTDYSRADNHYYS